MQAIGVEREMHKLADALEAKAGAETSCQNFFDNWPAKEKDDDDYK